MASFAQLEQLQERLGLTPLIGWKVATIISFAGGIEHHLERALWRLRGIDPSGVRPDTDAKMISDLIKLLRVFARSVPDDRERRLLENWCEAADAGFAIRHNIAHGAPMRLDDLLIYMRNPRWEGELRKREFGDFGADEPTLDLVAEAMAVLFRLIALISLEKRTIAQLCTPDIERAVQAARSVLGEFASQSYNPTYEKY